MQKRLEMQRSVHKRTGSELRIHLVINDGKLLQQLQL